MARRQQRRSLRSSWYFSSFDKHKRGAYGNLFWKGESIETTNIWTEETIIWKRDLRRFSSLDKQIVILYKIRVSNGKRFETRKLQFYKQTKASRHRRFKSKRLEFLPERRRCRAKKGPTRRNYTLTKKITQVSVRYLTLLLRETSSLSRFTDSRTHRPTAYEVI